MTVIWLPLPTIGTLVFPHHKDGVRDRVYVRYCMRAVKVVFWKAYKSPAYYHDSTRQKQRRGSFSSSYIDDECYGNVLCFGRSDKVQELLWKLAR